MPFCRLLQFSLLGLTTLSVGPASLSAAMPVGYVKGETWWDTLKASRSNLTSHPTGSSNAQWRAVWEALYQDFPDATAAGLAASLEKATRAAVVRDPIEFHVAVDGADSNAGTRAAPFATLTRARDAIRTHKHIAGSDSRRSYIVTVHGGTYRLTAPLRLSVEDSGTVDTPIVYRAAQGERVVLDGGVPINGPWRESAANDGIWSTKIPPELREAAPRFRQLFVDGPRATLARFPNFDPTDINRKGWLHVRRGPQGTLLAGLGLSGDWVEYAFEVPHASTYALWLGLATTLDRPDRVLALEIDGRPVPLLPLLKSEGWRDVAYSKAAIISLTPGRHVMRWSRPAPAAGEKPVDKRVHLDGFCLSDHSEGIAVTPGALPELAANESRVLLEAEDAAARTGGHSHNGFQKFEIAASRGPAPHDELALEPGTVKESWSRERQGEVYLFPAEGWFNTVTRIERVERSAQRPTRADPTATADMVHLSGAEARYSILPGNRFYVFNLRSELDAPGEWFLDYTTGELSYMPQPGETLASAEVVAPRLQRLVEFVAPSEGAARVEHITLRGFTFSHTDCSAEHPDPRTTEDCAVLLENAWHCAIEECTFADIGGYAVRVSLDSCLNRIARNTIARAGAGGILLRGPWVGRNRAAPVASPAAAVFSPIGNLIADNHIHHCGLYKEYVAGVHADVRPPELAFAPGNAITHNHIHDMPRNGIFVFAQNGGYLVEQNHVHDVLQMTDDGGLVHFCTMALNETAPTIVRNNLLHGVGAYRWDDDWNSRTGLEAHALGIGVYLDDYTSHVLIENNVIAKTRRGSVYHHHGENNIVRNNILLDDERYMLFQTTTWRGNRFEHNIVQWLTRTPDYANVTVTTPPTEAETSLFDYNVVWHGAESSSITIPQFGGWEKWRERGFDRHSVVAKPNFTALDLQHAEVRLAPDSPAFALGFRAIDLSRVGPRGTSFNQTSK